MKRTLFYPVGLLVLLMGLSTTATAQNITPSERQFDNGIGLNISLTNSGFGLGGYWQRSLSGPYSLIAEFTLSSGKDEKEQRFFTYFGESYIPGKFKYLLMLPIQAGVQRRVFSEVIQENFRPFIQLTAGPTFGWMSPYFNDLNGNRALDRGERTYDALSAIGRGKPLVGAGATFSIGANFGVSKKVTQGLRFGYTLNYFPTGVRLLEPAFEPDARKFFGTPTISLVFGRAR